MDQDRLSSLVAFVQSEDRVCPDKKHWHNFAMKIDNTIKSSFKASAGERERILKEWWEVKPLILSGWWASSAADKNSRLIEQLRFVGQHKSLLIVAEKFLRELPLDDWYRESTENPEYYKPCDPAFW